MNIFSGLKKFGLDIDLDTEDIYSSQTEEKEEVQEKKKEPEVKEAPAEKDLVFDKRVRCVVCDNAFNTKIVKSARIKRLEPDEDLRPRYQYIDTLKYDLCACPYCGYTAMNRYFEHLTKGQIRLVKENISSNFKRKTPIEEPDYDYDSVIERYKLALANTIVKRGKSSERAYTCLKIAWLIRGKIETMSPEGQSEEIAACEEEQEAFYEQAYEGLQKAIAEESFPICGMDTNTMDYLLAYMSYHFKKFQLASKFVSNILLSQTADRRVKDRALGLKELIVDEIRKEKGRA